jgi:Tol biopolymer transport system component/tRNA A-37 threonylcarbamoyl transferase component Bud32
MTNPERFQRVQELFHAAVKLSPAAREVFLRDECRADESLRQEIDSLLAEDGRQSGFVVTGFAKHPPWPAFVLAAGTRVGPYEISGMIGAGAMGEVYRARDARLHRDVALKVLPKSFADDPERIRRFRREAKLLASLNHPQIAAIYGLEESNGTLALVMELVEGPTLAERIISGPLSTAEASRYARQIGDALEAAHERGIIHRDLKPANVKITPEGTVKILDFGLGKALKPESGTQDPVDSSAASRAGTILGTAAYMSPEQARGAAVDHRADIWAFGVVLYEMLTGRRPFGGETIADVLASVVRDEPDFGALPPEISAVVARCLSKEPRNRWGSIGDVRWALDTSAAIPASRAPAGRMRYLPWAAAAVLALLAAAGAWMVKSTPSQPLMQMEITAPEGNIFGPVGWGQLAVSPDGRRLAFIATGRDGKRRLWLRSLESGDAVPLAGTENVGLVPAWSPDSRWLGFDANGRFQKIDVIAGGPPQTICECFTGGASWNSEGTILVTMRNQPLHWLSASGGAPAPLFGLDTARGEAWQGGPGFLPDGKRFVYDSLGTERNAVLASLDGKTRQYLGAFRAPGYVPNPKSGGWLMYVNDGRLFARPLNPSKGQFTGDSALVANAVGDLLGYSASTNGVLALRHTRGNPSQLTWFDRQGVQLSAPGDPGNLKYPRISPDQKTVAFVRDDAEKPAIWLLDLTQNRSARFTYDPGLNDYPAWSPDGSRIIFLSMRGNERLLLERPADSTGSPAVVFRASGDASVSFGLLFISKLPTGISPDGRWVIASEWFAAGSIVWLIPRTGNGLPIRFTEGADAAVSPDGRWLLYATAGPDGRLGFANSRPEVFVEALPRDPYASRSADRKWQISIAGGANPVWRGDGKEIFYLGLDGKMISVPVEAGANFLHAGPPKPLFQTRLVPGGIRQYDVTRDGKRFLLNVPSPDTRDEPITIIVNWPKRLER